jgi:hypothetical protein
MKPERSCGPCARCETLLSEGLDSRQVSDIAGRSGLTTISHSMGDTHNIVGTKLRITEHFLSIPGLMLYSLNSMIVLGRDLTKYRSRVTFLLFVTQNRSHHFYILLIKAGRIMSNFELKYQELSNILRI